MFRFTALSVVVIAAGLVLGAQQPPPQLPAFRAGVDLIDIDVSVLDKHRRPVQGLTATDFTVLEDGKPRPVVAFTPVDLPARAMSNAKWMDEIAPDVVSNDLQTAGRLVVILMDRSIAREHTPVARAIATQAIEQLRPGDLAAVVYSTFGTPQNFTADRSRLLAAVSQPMAGLPFGDRGESADCYCGRCSLEAIGRIAEAIRDVRQRRKLLLIVGSNIAVSSSTTCGAALSASRDRAIRAARAGNLTIYAFDPSGIPTLAPSASTSSVSRDRGALANLVRIGNLGVLPDHTGGLAVFGNSPADALSGVFRESDSYYVLGIEPALANRHGEYHDISVKVNRKDVILQARRGYYSTGSAPRPIVQPKGRQYSPNLLEALSTVWPNTRLRLEAVAVPLSMPGLQSGAVAVLLRAHRDRLSSTLAASEIEVLSGAFDRNGRPLGYASQTLSVRPPSGSSQSFHYEALARMELKHGRYEIRSAVFDPATGDTGSVYTYVEVPDFAAEPVSMSGLLLHDTGAAAGPSRALEDLLPFTPTARRQFTRGEQIAGFVRIYQGVRRPAMPLYVRAQILNDEDKRVFGRETRVLTSDLGANRAVDFSVDLPLTTLSAGEYLLTVDVEHGNDHVKRDVRFQVR